MDRREAEASNAAKAARDGPRLRSDYATWIEARGDGKVLIGGLGGFGNGRMWVTENPRHSEREGYATAPYDPDRRDGFGDSGR